MPLAEGSKRTGIRSQAGLSRSAGFAPAGNWVIDPKLPGLFDYHFGGWPRSKVVIPQGVIIAVGEPVRDHRTLHYKNVLTIADGTLEKQPFGVAPYNFYRRFHEDGTIAHDLNEADDFVPSVLTRDYIMVPYIPDPNVAKNVHWGLATNSPEDFGVGGRGELRAGDYVKPNENGKFVKWYSNYPVEKEVEVISGEMELGGPVAWGTKVYVTDGTTVEEATDVRYDEGRAKTNFADGTVTVKYLSAYGDPVGLRIGYVGELLMEVPPEGWLKWVRPVAENDHLRDEYETTPPPVPGEPYPYDPEYKWPLTPDYRRSNAWHEPYQGLPGLTSGDHVWRTDRFVADEGTDQEFVLTMEPLGTAAGAFRVYVNNRQIDTFSYVVDDNAIRITAHLNENDDIKVQYKAKSGIVGTPPGWDHEGSVGAAHILLMR